MLWWSWVGYAWLTSVVDPEEGAVRLAMFAAMAALLVAALCVPGAFGAEALLFACAYAVVRAAHIVLFMLASREDPALRQLGDRAGRQHGDRRRACCSSRRSPAGALQLGAVGARAGARHGRPVPVRRRRLEARARATSPSATG